MSDGQLTFDLGHRPALGRDDFLVAPCNAQALAWLERWPDWPSHALALFGPSGSGKSHLLAAMAEAHAAEGVARIEAACLSTASVPDLVAGAGFVLVDHLDGLADEAALFHLWNLTKENGIYLVTASREAPARLGFALPDLRSRLSSMPAIGIEPPDDSLLAALLVKHFADRQLRVGEDLVAWLVGRMERSFAAIGNTVEALDRASLAERRPITVPLARAVLGGMEEDGRQGELWEEE